MLSNCILILGLLLSAPLLSTAVSPTPTILPATVNLTTLTNATNDTNDTSLLDTLDPLGPIKTDIVADAPSSVDAVLGSATDPDASEDSITDSEKIRSITEKAKRMLDALAVIARRTLFSLIQPRLTKGSEFIGWHGTNELTAALWAKEGEIVRPTCGSKPCWTSGLDAELGPGLYISDTLSVAEAAAAINAQHNKLRGSVCAIFAKSSANWREARAKVQIAEVLRGNAPIKEKERESYITDIRGKTGRLPALRFGPLTSKTNQMMIVEQLNPNFEAQCWDLVGLDSPGAQAFEKAGNKVSYTNPSLIKTWAITREDVDLAKATVCAFEKICRK
ncbi:hypothetical protein FB451DRAFT_1375497 [Mycena latifolia]|nr:hypothetical protein FB451DRAFT_1375497 [Mycena latifolia]